MVKIKGKYLGNLRIESEHEPSKSKLITDAPVDNQGKGEAYSPTDLVATSLGTCILTTIGIVAERDGFDISGSSYSIEKEMSLSPRRIGALTLNITLPKYLTPENRTKLERSSMSCPVYHSLHPEIKITVNFNYTL